MLTYLEFSLVVSVAIAIYGLILYLYNFREVISHYKPFWKFFSIKIALFLSVWQAKILIFFRVSEIFHLDQEALRPIKLESADYFNNVFVSIEMFVLALLARKNFSYQDFRVGADLNRERSTNFFFAIPKIL